MPPGFPRQFVMMDVATLLYLDESFPFLMNRVFSRHFWRLPYSSPAPFWIDPLFPCGRPHSYLFSRIQPFQTNYTQVCPLRITSVLRYYGSVGRIISYPIPPVQTGPCNSVWSGPPANTTFFVCAPSCRFSLPFWCLFVAHRACSFSPITEGLARRKCRQLHDDSPCPPPFQQFSRLDRE